MSGHSKWSTIKHKKAAADQKRGKVFTKLIKEITIAAKMGGGDPDGNPRLRSAIAAGKSASMPKDNIDRAIKKGSGDLDGANYEEIVYEGYGPNNVAIIVEALTDNRNRTIASVRHSFSRTGGNLGAANSVQYMFDRKGSIIVEKSAMGEDELMEMALELGAEDVLTDDPEHYQILTESGDFENVRHALELKDVPMVSAVVDRLPQNRIEIDDPKKAEQVMRLIDLLEDDDDIQNVFTNVDFTEEALAE